MPTIVRHKNSNKTLQILTAVDPVKAILSISMWWEMAEPAVWPYPGNTFTTPGGKPAWPRKGFTKWKYKSWSLYIYRYVNSVQSTSLISAAMWRADNGVCSAGLMTTVLPQQRAGAIFQANIITGKFHCRPRNKCQFWYCDQFYANPILKNHHTESIFNIDNWQ